MKLVPEGMICQTPGSEWDDMDKVGGFRRTILVLIGIGMVSVASVAESKFLSLVAVSSAQTMSSPEREDATHRRRSDDTLRVMSLNLAHGRKDSVNQLMVRKDQFERNLRAVSRQVNALGIDVLALQEADAASRWSGNFDHVARLAEWSGFPARLHSIQASNWFFAYGTALLSRFAFADQLDHTFMPSPPTNNKGFTLGQIAWHPAGRPGEVMPIDLVSVHLDFSRESVRAAQVAELIAVLQPRPFPLVIMGDLNTDWFDDDQLIRTLIERLALHAYHPDAQDLGTYPSSGRRLDWILLSSELEFVDHDILPEILSDHLAVVATLRIDPTPTNN